MGTNDEFPESGASAIVGRGAELDALNTFVDSVDRGPAMLVLEGEPGLGKTTLWREGLHAAARRSFQVLECRPVQAEAQLAFTALSDLLADVPEAVFDELPAPQRRALQVALLRVSQHAVRFRGITYSKTRARADEWALGGGLRLRLHDCADLVHLPQAA